MTDLQDRYIPGISFKQLAAYTLAVAGVLALYFDIRSEIHENRRETMLTREFIQEDRQLRQAEIAAIRAELKQISENQRIADIKITILETIIKK